MVFVFGSNEAGRHGKGAAEFVRRFHGAIPGRGEGAQGNAYAIPTKDARLRPRPLRRIWQAVEDFLEYAASHPDETFQVTRVGCGLAGYRDEDIWRCLLLPGNCLLPGAWLRRLNPALMRVIVAGGRDYGGHKGEWQRLRQDLDQLRDKYTDHVIEIVSGVARGADSLGERWAHERGVPIARFPAKWNRHDKAAGWPASCAIGSWPGMARTSSLIGMGVRVERGA